MVGVAQEVASGLEAELSAGDRLRDLLQPRRYRGGRVHACRAVLVSAAAITWCVLLATSYLTPGLPLLQWWHASRGAERCNCGCRALP